MTRIFEEFPNEILLIILSNLSWLDVLISFWSLNKRFDILICSILSRNNNKLNSELVINEPGLSYNKCNGILSRLFSNSFSSIVTSSIRRIHFDERNSNSCDLIYEWLFDNNTKNLRFPNLKSLILTQCLLIKPLINSLSFLIKYHLDELTITFDEDTNEIIKKLNKLLTRKCDKNIRMIMLEDLIRQLFSNECRLTSLRLNLDCPDGNIRVHQCLKSRISPSSCLTLRRLHIHLKYTYLFEDLIEYVPILEELYVYFRKSLNEERRSLSDIEALIQTNGNWFNKVPKLECFTLKAKVIYDIEFVYLKWILNNLNHIRKLNIRLLSSGFHTSDNIIWHSIVDANFIRLYCMPDTIINLTHFDFYIYSKRKLQMNNTDKIINSFKIHPFFISHQWTTVKCYFDPMTSYQHLTSSLNNTLQIFNGLINHIDLFYYPYIHYVCIDLHPSLYLLLEQFNHLFPNVSCIKIDMEYYTDCDMSDPQMSLEKPFEIGKYTINDIQLHNVTRLDFDPDFNRHNGFFENSIDRTKARAKLLAHLISMPIQLKVIRIYEFEWLLHVIQYASNELRKNALNTVRYAEFGIPSCHEGQNESIHIGKNLLPFLSNYMPHLQTLHLWRPDDFPWTSIRPDFKRGYDYAIKLSQWWNSLSTSESINKHMIVFKQDLCQLVEKMKEFVFLDIHGKIHEEKLESYRSMVQTCFPNSQTYVEISRFRLWI